MSIVVFGSINMDLVCRLPRLPVPGETLRGSDFFTAPGGKGANQAVACARLGISTRIIGRIGDDVFGEILRQGLQESGVDVTHITTTPGSSGVALIYVDEKGENNIVIIAGANGKVGTDDLEGLDSVLAGADSLLLQLEIPLEAVIAAARMAHARGVRVILDPAPATQLPEDLYTLIDLLTPNEIEATQIVGFPVHDPVSAGRAAEVILNRGVKQVVIKMGKQGAYLHDGTGGELIPGYPVDTLDTTAAGDAFNGALAVALAKGMALREAVRFANAAGAISATQRGAQPSMPTDVELYEFLKWKNQP